MKEVRCVLNKRKMALFNYNKCPCKNRNCKSVVSLAKKIPVNVCNIIGDYNKADSFKCQCLKEKEESLMKEPFLKDEGLEKAEAQLLFFRSMFNKDMYYSTAFKSSR